MLIVQFARTALHFPALLNLHSVTSFVSFSSNTFPLSLLFSPNPSSLTVFLPFPMNPKTLSDPRSQSLRQLSLSRLHVDTENVNVLRLTEVQNFENYSRWRRRERLPFFDLLQISALVISLMFFCRIVITSCSVCPCDHRVLNESFTYLI